MTRRHHPLHGQALDLVNRGRTQIVVRLGDGTSMRVPRAWTDVDDLPERRRGRVFCDLYHQEIIKTPEQARHALSYVLNNWRKHREDGRASWVVDFYSTAPLFMGWKYFEDRDQFWNLPDSYKGLVVYFSKTWLLTKGWQKYGALEFDEVPSAGHAPV